MVSDVVEESRVFMNCCGGLLAACDIRTFLKLKLEVKNLTMTDRGAD